MRSIAHLRLRRRSKRLGAFLAADPDFAEAQIERCHVWGMSGITALVRVPDGSNTNIWRIIGATRGGVSESWTDYASHEEAIQAYEDLKVIGEVSRRVGRFRFLALRARLRR